ncbi:MAG: glycosyltransferase [Planctomycetes bacterium]|nr:glycosyltransferase [Planctomycetota bacterium]
MVATGYVPDEDLPSLYGRSDALLFLSHSEDFGLPPLEAMACGAPVVGSDRGALPEICGDAALLVDPRDPDGIAEAAAQAIESEELRRGLVGRGRARARGFTWEACARGTLAAYAGALDTVAPRPLARLF